MAVRPVTRDAFVHEDEFLQLSSRPRTDPDVPDPDVPDPDLPGATWLCAGCGQGGPLASAWLLVIHNRSRAAHRRELQLCASCVHDLTRAGWPIGPGPPQPRRSRVEAG